MRRYLLILVLGLLSAYSAWAQDAPLSPTGTILFLSTRDGSPEIYTMPANGEAVQRLTENNLSETWAAFSPDGQYIAFVVRGSDERDGLYIMEADGADAHRLTPGLINGEPSWSPDSQRLVFTRCGQVVDCVALVIDLDGSLYPLANSGHAAWSPDGELIALNRRGDKREIHFVSPSGGEHQPVTANTPATGYRYPRWSTDGQTLSYWAQDDTQETDEWALTLLDVGMRTVRCQTETQQHAAVFWGAWSPDGQAFAFFSQNQGQLSLQVINTTCEVQAEIEQVGWPVWSPDGALLLVLRNIDGISDMYLVDLAGEALYQLTDDVAIDIPMDWRP